jgi:hypothetical protein
MISRRFAFLAGAVVALFGAAPSLRGVPASEGNSASLTAHLTAPPAGGAPLVRNLDIWFTRRGSATAVRTFTVEMTKRLHLIIVSDDFRTFLHVHPKLGGDGHFTIEQRFPHAALYHLYADAVPAGYGHCVFRFDLRAGAGSARVRDLAPTGPRVAAGPYVVTLDRLELRAGADNRIEVKVTRAGRPAADLLAYLGAPAHAVFIEGKTLAYEHVHPVAAGSEAAAGGLRGDMAGMDMAGDGMAEDGMAANLLAPGAHIGPDMVLHVVARRPGRYKLWLQVRGSTGIYVAPFVLDAG